MSNDTFEGFKLNILKPYVVNLRALFLLRPESLGSIIFVTLEQKKAHCALEHLE